MADNHRRDPLGPGRQMTPSNEFGRLISQKITSEGETYYHHYDALGSTASLTDSSEVVTDEYDYEAFGDTAAESGATPNPYQWVAQVGYRKDEETGLYDLRRRNYSPTAGRFTSEDPVRSDEENLDRYVGNRAVQERDPSGLFPPFYYLADPDGNHAVRAPANRTADQLYIPANAEIRIRDTVAQKLIGDAAEEDNESEVFQIPLKLPNGKHAVVTNSPDAVPTHQRAIIQIHGRITGEEARRFITLSWTMNVISRRIDQLNYRIGELSSHLARDDRDIIEDLKSHKRNPRNLNPLRNRFGGVFETLSFGKWKRGLKADELEELAHNEVELVNRVRILNSLKSKYRQSGYDDLVLSAHSRGTVHQQTVEEGQGAKKAIEAFGIEFGSDESIYATGDEMYVFDALALITAGVKLTVRRFALREAESLADDAVEIAGRTLREREKRLAQLLDENLEHYLEREAAAPTRVLPEGKRGVDIGGGKFIHSETSNVTPDDFLSINPATKHGDFDFAGPTIRVEADIVGLGEDVLATFKAGSIPEVRISNLPYDAINDKMLREAARTLEQGGTLKLSTGAFALKNPNRVPSWISLLERNGITITSKNLDRGVEIIGVKR